VKILLLLGGLVFSNAFAQCGDLRNGHGPFDYRVATMEERKLVEDWHFNSNIQRYIARPTNTLGGDVDYTLRAFPNNHRALLFMMNLSVREKLEKPRGARYTVACYFDRAIRFRPDDGQVRMLHGLYLLRRGDKARAIGELKLAAELTGEDPNVFYNLGLAYFEIGDFEKSLRFAKKAYALGFPLKGLKNMLIRANKWNDLPDIVSEQPLGEDFPK
jgi:tetratricopeptide (TPR) repeat protein